MSEILNHIEIIGVVMVANGICGIIYGTVCLTYAILTRRN